MINWLGQPTAQLSPNPYLSFIGKREKGKKNLLGLEIYKPIHSIPNPLEGPDCITQLTQTHQLPSPF